MRRALALVSILAGVALAAAQVGAYLDFLLVPAPTASTSGPQGPADLLFGLMAGIGGVFGAALCVVAAVVGLASASSQGHRRWLIAIAASGALAILGLAVSAFVLLGASRNAYHPLVVFLVVPLTTLAYAVATRKRGPERK